MCKNYHNVFLRIFNWLLNMFTAIRDSLKKDETELLIILNTYEWFIK